jgi:glycosyltransferase involved in cell wall biosynthesis
MNKEKVVYIVTTPDTAQAFLKKTFVALKANGYDFMLISAPGSGLEKIKRELSIEICPIAMARHISLLADLISLIRIYVVLRHYKPAIVNYSTPKAALLGAVASWLARVPIRVYELRGLRLETVVGLKRTVLAVLERIASFCSTNVVCVSRSLLDVYRDMRLAKPHKLTVFGRGSYHGKDMSRYAMEPANKAEIASFARSLKIPPGTMVIGYVGRLSRDKGIEDLYACFMAAAARMKSVILLLVGPLDTEDVLPKDLVMRMKLDPNVRMVGSKEDVLPYYRLIDIFIFPSYREGLPNAPLEAAFAGIPTIGYAATGVIDAVLAGETGLLVPMGRVDALTDGLLRLLESDELRTTLGQNARAFALREYSSDRSAQNWLNFYSWRIL